MAQQVYAHRGASAYAPENTLEAFEMAASMHAHGVELDVHLTRDQEIVVCHDETIQRTANGEGWIRDFSLRELKAFRFNKLHPEFEDTRIPTLKEVFELLKPTGLGINIELKNSRILYPDLEKKCLELADQCNMMDRILFSSFNHHSLVTVKELCPDVPCGLLYEAAMVRPWEYAVSLGMQALHPHFASVLVPGTECRLSHDAGIMVNPWTVNTPADIDAVLDAGADIIITNFPDVALERLQHHLSESNTG